MVSSEQAVLGVLSCLSVCNLLDSLKQGQIDCSPSPTKPPHIEQSKDTLYRLVGVISHVGSTHSTGESANMFVFKDIGLMGLAVAKVGRYIQFLQMLISFQVYHHITIMVHACQSYLESDVSVLANS